jgi:putative addiction module component (TIGR02574 family)
MTTREQVLDAALQLSEQDRLRLAEELVGSVPSDDRWWDRWTAEAERRYERLASGEDPGLTAEAFWSDEG